MSILDEHIAEAVKLYGVSADAIMGRSRFQRDVNPRRYVMRGLRRNGWSLSEIGRQFGCHHTSVLHHTRGYEQPEPIRIVRPAPAPRPPVVRAEADPVEQAERSQRIYWKDYRKD